MPNPPDRELIEIASRRLIELITEGTLEPGEGVELVMTIFDHLESEAGPEAAGEAARHVLYSLPSPLTRLARAFTGASRQVRYRLRLR